MDDNVGYPHDLGNVHIRAIVWSVRVSSRYPSKMAAQFAWRIGVSDFFAPSGDGWWLMGDPIGYEFLMLCSMMNDYCWGDSSEFHHSIGFKAISISWFPALSWGIPVLLLQFHHDVPFRQSVHAPTRPGSDSRRDGEALGLVNCKFLLWKPWTIMDHLWLIYLWRW